MSKAGAIAASSVGAATITTGGYYLVKGVGSTGVLDDAVAYTLPLDVNTFKTGSFQNQECIQDLFGSERIGLNDSVVNPNSISTDFFGSSTGTSKGCLVINQRRKKEDGGKWSGAFT